MYDSKRKEDYINSRFLNNKALEDYIRSLFTRVTPLEEQLGKDCCEFTVSEIMEFYKSQFSTSVYTIAMMNSQYKLYGYYCLENNMIPDCQNHYAEIMVENFADCVKSPIWNERIISRGDLIRLCDEAPNPSDSALMLCMFEGICGNHYSEINGITQKDIEGNVLTLVSGRKVEISDKLKEYIISACNTYEYNTFAQESSADYFKLKKFDDTDPHMIKGMYNIQYDRANTTDVLLRQRIMNKLRRLKKLYNIPAIDSSALRESGRLELIRNIMQHENKNVREAISDKRIEERYSKIKSIVQYLQLYGEYLVVEGVEE